jgi:hypothetical protein
MQPFLALFGPTSPARDQVYCGGTRAFKRAGPEKLHAFQFYIKTSSIGSAMAFERPPLSAFRRSEIAASITIAAFTQ